MKTIGQQAKAFREHPDRNWSIAVMAAKVGTTRQNIENLECGRVDLPKYILNLADVMQTSTDTLLGRPEVSRVVAMQDTPPYHRSQTLESALDFIGEALSNAPAERHDALAHNLAGWAREGGADHYKAVLALLLKPAQRKGHRAA